MNRFCAAALILLVCFGVLTAWVPARWAPGAFQAGAFLLAAVWTANATLRRRPLAGGLLLIPLAGTVFWALMQLGANQTVYRWETWNAALFWAANFALCFLAIQVSAEPPAAGRFFVSLVGFAFGLSVVATVQRFTAADRVFWIFPGGGAHFVMGPFLYHNHYAAFIELTLPPALVAAVRDRSRTAFYTLASAAMYSSVIASASRSGFVLVSAEIAVVLLVAMRHQWIPPHFYARFVAALAGLIAVFTLVVGPEVLWDRFHEPDRGRPQMLRSTLDMVRARPWMGFGLGAWSAVYPAYARYDDGLAANQAHNDWAQWAAEGGLPFFALLLFVAVRSARPAVDSGWGLGVLCVFAHCLVDYPLQKPVLAGLFSILLGFLITYEKRKSHPAPAAALTS